jgi:triosephosphate isomerase
MARRKFIAGNWKLNKNVAEGLVLARELKAKLAQVQGVDVAVCPPFTTLAAVAQELAGSNIAIGAQNVHWEASGAFTGEISAAMLKEIPVTYVLIGHSERRQYFAETDETVNKRLKAALKAGLLPIVCVGETLAEREGNRMQEVIARQVKGAFTGIAGDEMKTVVIAYEPVWAIGTGRNATPEQAQEVHAFIRGLVTGLYGAEIAGALRIQYGGSVKADNARQILQQPDVDGALVGGASLKAGDFAAIIAGAV